MAARALFCDGDLPLFLQGEEPRIPESSELIGSFRSPFGESVRLTEAAFGRVYQRPGAARQVPSRCPSPSLPVGTL